MKILQMTNFDLCSGDIKLVWNDNKSHLSHKTHHDHMARATRPNSATICLKKYNHCVWNWHMDSHNICNYQLIIIIWWSDPTFLSKYHKKNNRNKLGPIADDEHENDHIWWPPHTFVMKHHQNNSYQLPQKVSPLHMNLAMRSLYSRWWTSRWSYDVLTIPLWWNIRKTTVSNCLKKCHNCVWIWHLGSL